MAGIDNNEPSLYETDPTGIYFRYKASVIGEGEPEVEEVLHREYRDDLTIEDGLKLAVKALLKILDKNFSVERVDAAYINIADKKFAKFSRAKIDKVFRELKKK